MTPRLLGRFAPDSPEWHQARSTRIGGSHIPVIMGWSPFETRADLLARMRGEQNPKTRTAAMDRGHYLEPAVRDWFATTTGIAVTETGTTYIHHTHDWALANPDALLADGSILEVKTAKEKTLEHGWGRQGTDQIPLAYAAQVQWYLGVCERDTAHIAVLFGAPFQFAKYKVRSDPAVFTYLLGHAATFHHQLTALEGIAA